MKQGDLFHSFTMKTLSADPHGLQLLADQLTGNQIRDTGVIFLCYK